MNRSRSAAALFRVPALIAVVSLAGLIVGLLGDGLPDTLANSALALPVVVTAYALMRARRGGWDR